MNTQFNELLYNDSPNLSAQGAAIIKVGDSLNSSVLSAGVAESFNKLKPFIESLNKQNEALQEAIKPFTEKLEKAMQDLKPFWEMLNKVSSQFKPLIDSLRSVKRNYVKLLGCLYSRAKQWVKALFTPSFLISRRFLSPPKFFTNKHFKLHSFFLTVLSSVITPNAPN